MAKITGRTLDHLKSVDRSKMESAFNSIYSEYSYLVYYVSFSITHDAESSKDITNEVFMKFYENRYNVNQAGNLKYYLLQVSKNLSLNQAYKTHPTSEMNEEENGEKDPPVDGFSAYIERFKGFLEPDEIDLVVYRFLYDFKFKDIAKELGVSVNVITSKYKRTIAKIKAHYPQRSRT